MRHFQVIEREDILRYDFGFEFEYDGEAPIDSEPYAAEEENENWPLDNINRFFSMIADHLYAAALAYDGLAKHFYPAYHGRSEAFFAIWDWYESFAEK